MSNEPARRDAGHHEVGRCYTRARRLPLMIGRLPGSDTALWGGPYTVTQVVVACSTAVALWWTRDLWAVFGVGWNGAILVGIPVAAALLVRRARVEGRDPLRVGLGVVSAVTAPVSGRTLTGAPWSPPGGVRLPAAPVRIVGPSAMTGHGDGGEVPSTLAEQEECSPGEVSQEEIDRLSRLQARGLEHLSEAEVDELLVTALRLYRQGHDRHGRHRRDDRPNTNGDGEQHGGGWQ